MDLHACIAEVGHRRFETSETISSQPAELYRLTFDGDAPPAGPGAALPAGRHGLYFQPIPARAELRADGSPARDTVVPDIPLPRRLFGSELTRFVRPLHQGRRYTMKASLAGVRESGALVLVKVLESIGDDEGVAVETERTTIFMGEAVPHAPAASPDPAPHDAVWQEHKTLDAIDLFRFSALTVNAHRAHYDQAWAKDVEGYPALLVHGPLTGMLLLDFALRQLQGRPASYEIRATAPLCVDEPFRLLGRPTPDGALLWAVGRAGVAMRARLTLAAGH